MNAIIFLIIYDNVCGKDFIIAMDKLHNKRENKNTWYFSPEPQSESSPKEITFTLNSESFAFTTDAGVFSREHVDPASRALIKAMPPLNGRVLDFGCGYGPIGICLAKINPNTKFELIDVNKRAVSLTAHNIIKNGITNATVYESNGFSHVTGQFDAIATNPPIHLGKDFLYDLFKTCKNKLINNGSLYTVFLRRQGAKSAIAFLEECFGNCQVVDKGGGIWVLHSQNTET